MAVRVCEKNHTPFERDQEKEEAFEHAWRKTSSLIDGIVEKKLFDSFDVVWRAVEEPDHSILRVITLSGLVMADHDLVLNKLWGNIQQRENAYCAVLQHQDCNSTIHNCLRSFCAQLLNPIHRKDSFPTLPTLRKTRSRILDTERNPVTQTQRYESLQWQWGKETRNLEKKMKELATSNPLEVINQVWRENELNLPFIVLLNSMETFSTEILNELFTLLQQQEAKFMLIAISSISGSNLYRLVSGSALSNVDILEVATLDAVSLYEQLVYHLFLERNCPIVVGSKVIDWLQDYFLLNDMCIQSFKKHLKFILLDFSIRSPFYPLLSGQKLDSESIIGKLSLLSEDKTEQTDEIEAESALPELSRLEVHINRSTFIAKSAIMIVEILGGTKPKNFTEVYSNWFSGSFLAWSSLSQAMIKINQAPVKTLEELIALWKIILSHPSAFNYFQMELEVLDHLDILVQAENNTQSTEKTRNVSSQSSSSNSNEILHSARKEIHEFICYFFTVVSPPFLSFRFSKWACFNSVADMDRNFLAEPRKAIIRALKIPCDYLSMCKKSDSLANSPDICILYNLYCESDRLINLYDYFKAFSEICSEEMGALSYLPEPIQERKNKRKADEMAATQIRDYQSQGRFLTSVNELQYMGFLAPTNKRRDHVEKLSFDFTSL